MQLNCMSVFCSKSLYFTRTAEFEYARAPITNVMYLFLHNLTNLSKNVLSLALSVIYLQITIFNNLKQHFIYTVLHI